MITVSVPSVSPSSKASSGNSCTVTKGGKKTVSGNSVKSTPLVAVLAE